MAKFSDDPIWVTSNWEKIHISQMSNQHLLAALNLLREREGWRTHFIAPMLKELNKRGLLKQFIFDCWFYKG